MFMKKNHKVATITPNHNKLHSKIAGKLKPAVNIIKPLYIFLLVAAVVISAYHTVFANRIIPGVVIGNTNVGGLSFKEALTRLKESEEKLNKDITYNFENKTFKINKEDIKFEYKWEVTLSRAYEIGRSGDIYTDSKDKLAGFFKYLSIKPFYDYDDILLSAKLLGIGAEIAKEGSDAKMIIKDGKLTVLPAVTGSSAVKGSLYKDTVELFDQIEDKQLFIQTKTDDPDILEEDLKTIFDRANKIVFAPFKVTYGKREWKFTPEQILNLLTVNKEKTGFDLALNKDNFESYLETLGSEVKESPKAQVTKVNEDKVEEFKIIKNGKELEVKKFTEDFKNALFDGKSTVEAAVNEVSVPEDKSRYGIKKLLGEGVSKFTGSGQPRIHNLALAAERTNGVLVPPGNIYSFNKSVGEINGMTGYDTAYIISNGRTVLGEGGGVCQTSTTMFRAILNAGLPIVSRFPHAYRVYYYELDSPVGFDASIFQPSLDLQFKNDTPAYILVQTEFDPKNYTLKFKLFGTDDGRKVEITKPVVTNVVAPPEPLYQEDPTLPEGSIKQIDFAAWGASVTFTRTVTREDKELYKDTFSSRYQPWRAIYLKGTKK
ncbi:MAG TPA: VanW family protein [Patescibacteria group bacterium]|nr:VanW family protein [Patescibacteria group bacterium]